MASHAPIVNVDLRHLYGDLDAEIQQRAIHALDAGAPEPARLALESGALFVRPGAQSWQSSDGAVHGRRIAVGATVDVLALLDAQPHAFDAIQTAVARATSSRAGNVLVDLITVWLPRSNAIGPYRGAVRRAVFEASGDDVRQALADYLAASGHSALASRIGEWKTRVVWEGESGRPGLLVQIPRDTAPLSRSAARALVRNVACRLLGPMAIRVN